MDATTPHGAAVSAEGYGLKGPRGWVFRDVTFAAPPGALIAVAGPSGSGRTCLLLALTGRMRATAGHAEIAGIRLPKHLAAVRKLAALGPVDGVAELEAALTVGEHLRERALLQRRFEGPLGVLLRPRRERAAQAQNRIDRALSAAGLDVGALPKGPRTHVRDLERLEALRLGVALALLGEPRLLAVDDVDHKLSAADRDAAWAMLRAIAEAGTTVLAVCTEAPEDALVVRPQTAEARPGTPESGPEAGPGGEPETEPPAEPRSEPRTEPRTNQESELRTAEKSELRTNEESKPRTDEVSEPRTDEVSEPRTDEKPEPTEGTADAYAEARRA